MTDVDWAPIFFVLVVSTTAVQSKITKGPTNALKKVGDNVTLECVTSSSNCDGVEWKKMEGAQSPRTVYTGGIILNGFKERYSVNSTGGCSLTITQLNISDSGRFSCVTLTVDGGEEIRSSILVVIDVTEACLSNVPSDGLSQYDVYSFWTIINVPAKSVEQSNVTMYFQNKAANETKTMNDKQPLTVLTTLTGIARKENITQRVCVASFLPNTATGFDRSIATLDVCTTPQLIVSYLAENIAVSPTGTYYKGATVRCKAEGYPYPTIKWTHLKSGQVVEGDTLVIKGEAGDKYNCTATNTIKGKATSQSRTIEVFSHPPPPEPGTGCGPGCLVPVILIVIITILVGIWIVGWKLGWWPLWFCFPGFLKKDGDITGLCCTCCTCFSISYCAICKYCTYFACCVDYTARAKEDGKSTAQPLNEVVSSEAAEPVNNSTATVLEKPLTEVVVSSEAAKPVNNSTATVSEKPLTNSTTTVSEKPVTEVLESSKAAEPLTNSTTTVPEKPLTEVVVSSKAAEPLRNSTTAVPEKPLTNSTTTEPKKQLNEVVESSEAAEPLTNSTATGPQKPPRVSYSAPTDVISTSQTEARTSGQ